MKKKHLIMTLLLVFFIPIAAVAADRDTTQAVKIAKKAAWKLKNAIGYNEQCQAMRLYKQAAEMGLMSAQMVMRDYCLDMGMTANAMKWTYHLAENEDAESEFLVALAYYKGEESNGFKQSDERAFYWARRAVEHEAKPLYVSFLALCYEEGKGVAIDTREAIRLYELSGNDISLCRLGVIYRDGNGVYPNKAKAVEYFTKSAEAGNEEAQFYLGYAYSQGDGVVKNLDEAIYWYTKASDKGLAVAKNNLAVCMEEKNGVKHAPSTETFYLYKMSAEKGNGVAQYNLGNCYLRGEGVEPDTIQAFGWYKKSAESGCIHGQRMLALCFTFGAGTEVDEVKAFHWLQQAAEQSDTVSILMLAETYANGIGTAKDETKALSWYEKAADMGNVDALVMAGRYYMYGIGTAENKNKALEYLKRAGGSGNDDALYLLGLYYSRNNDSPKAFGYFEAAAEKNNTEAMYGLALMYLYGEGVKKNKLQAIKWMNRVVRQTDDEKLKQDAKDVLKEMYK